MTETFDQMETQSSQQDLVVITFSTARPSDRVGRVSYAVLWLPSRFKHLHIYLAVLLCAGVVLAAYFCCGRPNKPRSRSRGKLAGV